MLNIRRALLASPGVHQHSGVMGITANLLAPPIQRYGSLAQQPTVRGLEMLKIAAIAEIDAR